MKLEAIYDKQDDIPEVVRDLYTEKSGKWRLTGIEGIKTQADVDDLQRALANEREARKRSKEGLFEDAEDISDPSAVREMVMAHVHAQLLPLGREVEQARGRWEQSDATVREFALEDNRRAIRAAARAAAAKLNILPEAVEDALLLADRDLAMDDKGVIASKTGATLEGWLHEVGSRRPHWWPPSTGGGATGSSWFKRDAGRNPWSREHWNITDQGKFVEQHGRLKAEEHARRAGSRFGATEPPPARR